MFRLLPDFRSLFCRHGGLFVGGFFRISQITACQTGRSEVGMHTHAHLATER